MNSDKPDGSMSAAEIVSLFRGLYNRVARQLRVDPSYVSRVARGQRESEEVRALLEKEIRRILKHAHAIYPIDGRLDGHATPRKLVPASHRSGKRAQELSSNGNHGSGKAAKATRKKESSRADAART